MKSTTKLNNMKHAKPLDTWPSGSQWEPATPCGAQPCGHEGWGCPNKWCGVEDCKKDLSVVFRTGLVRFFWGTSTSAEGLAEKKVM